MCRYCLDCEITGVVSEKTNNGMEIPSCCGIDMGEDADGVGEIRIVLGDGIALIASGCLDSCSFAHGRDSGESVTVPLAD